VETVKTVWGTLSKPDQGDFPGPPVDHPGVTSVMNHGRGNGPVKKKNKKAVQIQ